ncbi:MAG TPA: outer membrane beta-barrel protein [Chitinophagaceae bacterium]|jgi:hypothetical protein|nr:outer membrane beta-barrel protein [Chitinophagaceae bacterium]
MSEFNDHKLFELSKKAAEGFHDSSLIPTWDKMEQQLDRELPVKKKRRRVVFFWMLLSVFIGGIVYLSANDWYNVKHTNLKETQLSSPIKKTDEANQSNTQKTRATENIQNTLNKAPQLQQVNDSKENTLVYENGSDNILLSKHSDEIGKRKTSIIKKESRPSRTSSTLQLFTNNKSDIPTEANSLLMSSTSDTLQQNAVAHKAIDFNPEEITANQNTGVNNSLITIPTVDDSTSNNLHISTSRPQKQIKRNSRFSIAAIVGTNFNDVKFNHISKQGLDYGLLMGYRITPNIELRTGLLISKKYFNADGKVISFDSAKLNLPSYSSINLQHANGYCRFIEIPVMFLYHFSPQKKTGFYAGAGLSISKMRMENIDYTFLIDASTVVERTHAGIYHNMNSSFTSLTSNFSIGVKRKLSQNWSIAAEPYIKLPLTKINDSNLKLTTFGATLIFTFHPALRNRNK